MALFIRVGGFLDAFAVISSVLFFTASFAKFGQNDFMYATAPIFWRTLPLYEDLMFVQAPGSIIVYGLIYELVKPQNFFLALRFFSLAVLMAASLLVYFAARAVCGRMPATIALIFLYTSHFFATAALDAGSVTLALLFLGVALYVYLSGPVTIRGALVIGISLGIAASMKLNFALYAIPFGLFISYKVGIRSREFLAYVGGGLIGSSAIWYYAIINLDQFWFFNFRYHMLMNEQRTVDGQNLGSTFVAGTGLFLLYISPLIYLLVKILRKEIPSADRRVLFELGIFFAFSLLAAFAPMVYMPQYMAPPVFILSLLVAFTANRLLHQSRPISKSLCKGLSIAALVWVLAFWIQEFPLSSTALAWNTVPTSQMKSMRARIDRLASIYLDGSPCRRTAISLSPIPLIGTSFEISPLSASGQFLPMVTPQIEKNAPEFSRFGLTVDNLNRAHVAAFLVGYFRDANAERLIMTYARENSFVAFDVGTLTKEWKGPSVWEMQLLLRRDCISRGAPSAKPSSKNADDK